MMNSVGTEERGESIDEEDLVVKKIKNTLCPYPIFYRMAKKIYRKLKNS